MSVDMRLFKNTYDAQQILILVSGTLLATAVLSYTIATSRRFAPESANTENRQRQTTYQADTDAIKQIQRNQPSQLEDNTNK